MRSTNENNRFVKRGITNRWAVIEIRLAACYYIAGMMSDLTPKLRLAQPESQALIAKRLLARTAF